MIGQRPGVICCGMASELDDARCWSRMFCAALRAELRRPSDADEDARAAGLSWLPGQIRQDRYYAAHLLGDLKDPRGVPILVSLLKDPT